MELTLLAILVIGASATESVVDGMGGPLTLAAIKAVVPSWQGRHHGHMRAVRVEEKTHFGDAQCPCIGFDGVEGETTVVFNDAEGKEVNAVAYPASLGAHCEDWDNGRHASCKEGQTPGFGEGWCKQKWCYVDPCNCQIPVLPKMSTYSPDAMYRGKPLFYSYNTCGGKDTWTKGVPEVGTPGCRCIGFDNVPGTTEMKIGKGMVDYPAEVGGSCQAWDNQRHPMCMGKNPPKWCTQNWCYVDPCSCSLSEDTPPKISMYLPSATFTGKGIYYSYETCKSEDHFTEEYHKKACVNQDTKEKCTALPRCAWTGEKCLGAELFNHPLCKDVVKKEDDDDEKSSATCAKPLLAAAAATAAVLTLA